LDLVCYVTKAVDTQTRAVGTQWVSQRKGKVMPVESSGKERGNPRMFALIENSPKTGESPTVWAFPQFVEFLRVAGQPVQGPWPPHQEPRPDPDADSMPTAVPDTGH
jgi:hypothetical protein